MFSVSGAAAAGGRVLAINHAWPAFLALDGAFRESKIPKPDIQCVSAEKENQNIYEGRYAAYIVQGGLTIPRG